DPVAGAGAAGVEPPPARQRAVPRMAGPLLTQVRAQADRPARGGVVHGNGGHPAGGPAAATAQHRLDCRLPTPAPLAGSAFPPDDAGWPRAAQAAPPAEAETIPNGGARLPLVTIDKTF